MATISACGAIKLSTSPETPQICLEQQLEKINQLYESIQLL
jgi:hypothetical protein